MSDLHREQRPLLCDDYSEEEFDVKSYNFQRRNRPFISSGRARNHVKGAAAVLTRWPDHCSTSVAYWWLGVSMIIITIFVIYNSVLIFGMIPTSDMKQPKYRKINNEVKPKPQTMSSSEVYMHLIVNNNTDKMLEKHLPYVSLLSEKYPSFKYNLIAVLNDTLKDLRDFKDEERNEIAFNSLWANKKLDRKISNRYNISVEYISLTAYLKDSPITKFWRHLPPHLIEFLVRSLSIWEKGGIAFNPKILIPKLYKPNYTEKLYEIFNQYINSSTIPVNRKIKAKLKSGGNTKRPNNIRDIINDLDKDDNNISNIDLSVAENKDMVIVSNTENILKLKRDIKFVSKIDNIDDNLKNIHYPQESNMTSYQEKLRSVNSTDSTRVVENMLPLFIKYLFDDKPRREATDVNITHPVLSKNSTSSFNRNEARPVEKSYKPSMVMDEYSTSTISNNSNTEIPDHNLSVLKNNNNNNIPKLSIDIKGNIIASKMACHAFLGTIFSNVIQHSEEETVSDFIISELSLFCNGRLTSCAGINVILV